MAKYTKKAAAKIERTLHEFKVGKLKSGGGRKVKSRQQAIAIALSQARRAGYKVPPAPRHHAKRKKTPAQLEREIALKELQKSREQLLRALGYAGNTAAQVARYHDQIAAIDDKIRAL